MDKRILEFTLEMDLNPPAATDIVAKFQSDFGFVPPADYVEFMTTANGGEGGIGEHRWLQLWRIEEIKPHNVGYNVQEFAPGLVLFGSNGGGEAYGFDVREVSTRIVEIPFIVMDWKDAIPCGESLVDLLEYLVRQ